MLESILSEIEIQLDFESLTCGKINELGKIEIKSS